MAERSDGYGVRAAGAATGGAHAELPATLRRVLTCLLPDGLEPGDWDVAQHLEAPSRDPGAFVVLGGTSPEARARLAGAGHGVHQLTAVPGLDAPRALVPGKYASDAAAALLAPNTQPESLVERVALNLPARLPQAIVRRLGAPFTIVTHPAPAMVEAFDEHAPGAQIGMRVNRMRPDRAAAHAIDGDGHLAAYAKFVRAGSQELVLDRERAMLEEVARIPALRDSAPRALALARASAGSALVTTSVCGKPAGSELTEDLRAWLGRCRLTGEIALSNSELVTRLEGSFARLGDRSAPLRDAATRALAVAGTARLPRTLTHGDFVPWNVMRDRDRVLVVDWEQATLQGIPFWDEIYFTLHSGLVKRGWGAGEMLAALRALDAEHEPDADALRPIAVLVLARLGVMALSASDASMFERVRATLRLLEDGAWLAPAAPASTPSRA